MVHAQKVLRQKPTWSHFEAHIDHALRYGYDQTLRGMYSRGVDDQPATDTDKIWWVQAELLAALTDALQHENELEYAEAFGGIAVVLAHSSDAASRQSGAFSRAASCGAPDEAPLRSSSLFCYCAPSREVAISKVVLSLV